MERQKKSKNGIFIIYEYNKREIDGIEEFQQNIENDYSCQGKAKWLPSCSEGGEFFLKIIFETDWRSFISSAILGGILWDSFKIASKEFIVKPLSNAIDQLINRNKDSWKLRMEETRFCFNDIEIVIYGLSDCYKNEVNTLLSQIDERIEEIEKQCIGFPIQTIKVPYRHINDYSNNYNCKEYLEEPLYLNEIPLSNCYWKVIFQDGTEIMYHYNNE